MKLWESYTLNKIFSKVQSRFLSVYYKIGGTVHSLKKNNQNNIVVSLTSFTPRLEKLYISLGSIFNQSMQPNKVILYLGSDVNMEKLPSSLTRFCKYGLEIKHVDDLKSHKKYFYAFQEYKDSLIITVDDDLIYHKNMIKKLYQTYMKYPECICAMRTHEIIYDNSGAPRLYGEWVKNSKRYDEPSFDLFFTSGAGTLFSPRLFDERVIDLNAIKQYCFTADDIWLNCMCRLAGTRIVNVKLTDYERRLVTVSGTQEVALKHHNLYSGNDVCIENMIKQYGIASVNGELK
ncbi:MAG: hypothetical protein IJL30_01845 [Clostridia bacterium]|nr:hypothetical protein [Clostridia bacterium]